MSAMSELHLEIQSMAHEMCDDFGQDADTVLTIARIFNLPAHVVQDILDPQNEEDVYYGA